MRISALATALLALSIATTGVANAKTPPPKADPQMQAVLNTLASLGGKPIEKLTPDEARQQPTAADAVKALLKKQGKSTAPEPVASVQDMSVPGPAGNIPVRVYTPSGTGPFPVVVYIHGGGWVIASIQTYDSSPRAIANLAHCVVISVGYREAPEAKFPAAHEDCYSATEYIISHADQFGGDPKRVAIMGESAGGNMAAAVCLMARDRHAMAPIYQVLVYPVANYGFDTPSYKINADAKPLNKAMMKWFFHYYMSSPADASNPYLSIDRETNLKDLPPATVITDQIDPLMSEGQTYANHLSNAGIKVSYKNYDGVTHEFFGMGAVLDKAKDAEAFAADGLKSAFGE